MKLLIVGGVAGGAGVAARARRLDEQAEIIIFERGPHVSFSNCALPYYLGGIVEKSSSLILMDPQKFKSRYNIDVRTGCEVISIDRRNKTVAVRDLQNKKEYQESYDKLVLSPGAKPVIPSDIKGIDLPHIFTIRNVPDIVNLDSYIRKNAISDAAILGGGFIGIEAAENLTKRGIRVSVIGASPQILAPFDYDMAQILQKELLDHHVNVFTGEKVEEITPEKVILSSGKEVPAGIVIVTKGVAPETSLARNAGLEIGITKGIKVNHNYQTSDPDIYAVGDAIEVYNRMTRRPGRLALAGPAQREARAAADHIYSMPHNNNGVIGSSVLRVFDLNAASTGLNEKQAKKAGIPYDFVYIIPSDKVGIIPGSNPMHFKLLYEYPSGKIIGAQAIGKGNVDKRVDVIATAISFGGTLEDLKELELCYSPLFGTARDVINLAALVGLNNLYGKVRQVPVTKVRELVESGAFIIDVRERDEYAQGHLLNAINIPLSEFRKRLGEIPTDISVYLHCRTGQRSYNAYRVLENIGYRNVYNISGSFLGICCYEYFNDVTGHRKKIVTKYNFE